MTEAKEKLPHWDLSNVFSGLEGQSACLDGRTSTNNDSQTSRNISRAAGPEDRGFWP